VRISRTEAPGLKDVPIDRGERSFFGKVLELIDKEGARAKPRQAPDLVRDLVAVLAKLIEEAPENHRDGLRAIIYNRLLDHLGRIGTGERLELPNEYEGQLQ
jgi:hypothetical protein